MDNYKQKPWYRLDVDTNNAIAKGFDWRTLVDFNQPLQVITIRQEDYLYDLFDQSWLDYWQSTFNFKLEQAFIFWRHGELIGGHDDDMPHIDTYFNEPFRVHHYGLNWTIDYRPFWDGWKNKVNGENDTGSMSWYHINDNPIHFSTLNVTGRSVDKVNESFSVKVKNILGKSELLPFSTVDIGKQHKPTLVNTSIPHKIISHQPRLLVSIRNLLPDHREDMLWPDIVERFKHLIIE